MSNSFSNPPAVSPYFSGAPNSAQRQDQGPTLRRRNPTVSGSDNGHGIDRKPSGRAGGSVVQKMDFMFPKVHSDFTVQTDRGGAASLVAYILIAILLLAETFTWLGQNRATSEHISVDTSLGKRMRVNINITFPALACEDLHVDAMDVAGDSQINVADTMVKRKLHLDGRPLSKEEIKVETNAHRQHQETKERLLKEALPEDYCGPCYGAQDTDEQCCNACDDVIDAYSKKKWRTDALFLTAEQCIREGRDKREPKLMTKGQGCQLSGYMTVNRVAGNFHIAMGEGIERNGRHIHTFVPEDAPNFNASHTIHELTFGPDGHQNNGSPLNGVSKIVKEEHGTTGLFQYFIKVVPTNYVGMPVFETNRYFFTERFRPLMGEEEVSDEKQEENENDKRRVANAGHGGGHSNKDHHKIQNSVLPGVFFIYEIYPFAVEISQNSVPFTHLLIRLMASVGGIFTIVKLADAFLDDRDRRRGR
ncbi:reticulum-Golgi intermediate compartment protein 3 [Seminavis robusta]|uniref:Reticulum-Golgi intermediate compartment protein 3 n=1 Tax=Seminavis robusta TaxID=568900 RepID=A0A9N8HYT2_9STRA|nr:reticulum-Golgi intermediate compartment protein 3 [Seminavis robusta]|eukprot:Sro2995_g341810.1 reticulum-Golgi intermediate compartment protein 3 (476) ;mRNA; r:8108-9597